MKLGEVSKQEPNVQNSMIQAVDQQPENIVSRHTSDKIKVRQHQSGIGLNTDQAPSRHDEPASQALAKSQASRDLGSLQNQENS